MIEFLNTDNGLLKDVDWKEINNWLIDCIESKGFQIDELNFVFMSDEELLDYNKRFLNHDYYTDIITFDNTEGKSLNGDLLISIDRVFDNSKELSNKFLDEFCRVLIHGILHMMGYGDKTKNEIILMREMEDECLSSRCFT